MAFGDFTVDRNSTKYVLGSGGTIVSYPTDEPAFEFNADGTYKGLLVEPAATNIQTYSEDFTTTWYPNNATITANVTTAPDGNTTADNLANNDVGGSGYHYVSQSPSLTISTQYTFSVFAKYNTGSGIIWLLGEKTADIFCYFDVQNGSVTQSTNFDNATITDYGNGWYRCSATFTKTSATGSEQVGVGVCLTTGTPNFDSTGIANQEQVYLWGAQLETGPIATSYIPTTTASVTRVKDDITQTGAQSLIGQSEGTLYVEVDWKRTSGADQTLLDVSDGTFSNRMLIYNTSGGQLHMQARAGNTTLTSQGVSSTAYSGIQKIAFAYKTDDFELYRNGSSISSDTSGSLAALATLTDIDLGQFFGAGGQANMHIRAVAIYPKRLGAVELEVLTGAPTYVSYALMASSLGYTVE